MDSTTDKERNDQSKWPKEKGPSYLATFLFEFATFLMRIGLRSGSWSSLTRP